MTAFDFIVVGIVGISTVLAFLRGFVRVSISLAAWVIGVVAAMQYSDLFAAMLPQFSGGDAAAAANAHSTRYIVAFALIVTAALLVGTLVGWLISRLVRVVGLGFVDRSLGGVLGVARGLLIVVLVILGAGMTNLPQQEWWQNALLSPPLVKAALELKPWLPQRWAERIDFGRQKRLQDKPTNRTGVV